MARFLVDSSGSAGGRVVALLEGGYAPRRLADGVVEVVRAFAGLPSRVAD
jgi:acetoin utilization deacetylase AcuC-like enzyme